MPKHTIAEMQAARKDWKKANSCDGITMTATAKVITDATGRQRIECAFDVSAPAGTPIIGLGSNIDYPDSAGHFLTGVSAYADYTSAPTLRAQGSIADYVTDPSSVSTLDFLAGIWLQVGPTEVLCFRDQKLTV